MGLHTIDKKKTQWRSPKTRAETIIETIVISTESDVSVGRYEDTTGGPKGWHYQKMAH